MNRKGVERIIDQSKENRRVRIRGIVVLFGSVLIATFVVFFTAAISVNVLCKTAMNAKEESSGSSDEYQDIRYSLVDGNLIKEYLSDEDIKKQDEDIKKLEEQKRLEEEKQKTEDQTKNSAPVIATPNGKKTVYLTFDDGPGNYTTQLLNVLKKYNVKATFFVTCKGSDDLIKREYDEGHTVALHTCSHNYADVYSSDDAYFNDLQKVSDRVKRITGVETKLVRFPGGSSNTVSAKYSKGIMSRLSNALSERGFVYFDWNVSSGDAGGGATSSGMVYNNVIDGINKKAAGSSIVVLQHDVKSYSVNAVESIIQYGLKNGYTFLALNMSSPTMHQHINN